MKSEGVTRSASRLTRGAGGRIVPAMRRMAWVVGAYPYTPSQAASYTRQAFRWLVAIRVAAICTSVDVSAMLILMVVPQARDWNQHARLGPLLAQLLPLFLIVFAGAVGARSLGSESHLGHARHDISKGGTLR